MSEKQREIMRMNSIGKYEYIDDEFYSGVKAILEEARKRVYRNIQNEMVLAYWQIGKIIVEKQGGDARAEYGAGLIKELSAQMTKDFGKGFDESNLRRMRQFYVQFPNCDTVCHELSWSHFRLLIGVENKAARDFYSEECVKSNWSVRQLQREINTFSYQRYIASRENYDVVADTAKREPADDPKDIIKDPYVLEFAGLKPSEAFYEDELEQALIDHLQEFLLELGRGFSFVARQKRFDMDGQNFYVDLVFYNFKAKCFVLIDLKRGELTHQDIGQMQMYVNYYTREEMNEGDNPPIGIILCADKSDTLVKYTLPEDNKQIFASKYLLYIPTEEELKNEINNERKILEEKGRG